VTTLLVAAALLVPLAVAAELLARWWIRVERAYYVFPPGLRLRLHLDRKTLPELDPIARFEVNSDGERGSDVPRVARGRTLYRVLVAGGSQPEGYFLDQDATWPGALQRMLATDDHLQMLGASAVHVGCVARSGVGSETLDVLLSRLLPRYPRLSAIVILVGASDVLRWLEEGAPQSPSSPVPTSDLFRCHPEGPFGWGATDLAITELVRRARRRWLRPVHVHEAAGRWIGDARHMRAHAKVIRATMPDPDAMLAHFETHLRRVIERACEHADRVVLVRQSWFGKSALTPEEAAHMWHGGAGQVWREEVTTYYSIEVTSRLMALMDARAARVAGDLGVDQIDLMAILEPTLATYYDFFHLTAAGATRVASAVADTLLRQRGGGAGIKDETSPCVDLRAS
jgi:lysophospholipase L1-like esterase